MAAMVRVLSREPRRAILMATLNGISPDPETSRLSSQMSHNTSAISPGHMLNISSTTLEAIRSPHSSSHLTT